MRVPLADAARICGVKPDTFRKWVQRGHITRRPDECGDNDDRCEGKCHYDVSELLHWIDSRNPDALKVRAGMTGDHATRLARSA